MNIHIISTVNGQQNEGMRNVATHLGKSFEKENNVVYSALNDVLKIPARCLKSDVTMIFARCVGNVYIIARVASFFSKNLKLFLVQKPAKEYQTKNNKNPINADYYTICEDDAKEIRLCEGKKMIPFTAGINAGKFSPVSKQKAKELKAKYGFDTDKPLVVHVGHLSTGRGLEDFVSFSKDKYSRLIVASGMFENENTVKVLEDNGVKIIRGYLENVNEVYQMADVYLFPTKTGDYVISLPLSVMEALSCGVPVIAYKSFEKINAIDVNDDRAVVLINNQGEIEAATANAVSLKCEKSYLSDAKSWDEIASEILNGISRDFT